MLNLIISIFLVCSSFGFAISKTTTSNLIRKQREHKTPLSIDKEVI